MLKKIYGCFQKWWYHQIIHCNRVFRYKPSILGYPYFWKHPHQQDTWTPWCRKTSVSFVSEVSPLPKIHTKGRLWSYRKNWKKNIWKQQQKVFFCQRRPCGDFITLRFFQMWFLNSDSYWPFLSKVGPKGFRVKHQRKTQQRSTWWFQIYFSKGLKPPTSDPWITSWTPPGRFPCADCRSAIQGAKDPKSLSRPRFDASPKLSLYQSRNMWM